MRALAAALLVLCASVRVARAQDADETKHTYRSVVDRVELEPSTLTGLRLRVYLSALTLRGERLDLSEPKSIKTYLGSSELKAPYSLGTFDATHGDLDVVVLVQATLDFTDVLPMITESLERDLVGTIADSAQIVVLPYGEAPSTGKLSTAKALRGKLSLTSDGSVGDPALLDTLDRALLLLRKHKGQPEAHAIRKVVVVIGDGRDAAADRDRVTRTGEKAAKEGVRIHAIGFAPNDIRRPLFAMGELAKQSRGTFRWVRTPTSDAWKAAIEQLRSELEDQYVLTYFVGADDDVAGKKLKVVTVGRYETTSNELKVPSGPTCGGVDCATGYCAADTCVQIKADGGRGVLGWLLLIGGIAVGAVVVLGVVGFFITKAQQRSPSVRPPPGMPPQAPVGPARMLLVMTGPQQGMRYPLFNGFLIGQQPGCNLTLPDGAASSQHAQIGIDAAGNCVLYDRGSTNGTYINGVRITQTALQNGCTIRIGSTDLRFLAE